MRTETAYDPSPRTLCTEFISVQCPRRGEGNVMCSPGTISVAMIRFAGQPSCYALRASTPTVTMSQNLLILEQNSQQDLASNNSGTMPPLLSPRASAFGHPERRAIAILQHIAC